MKTLHTIALVALALLGITAVWGGAELIRYPTGAPMQIPLSLLQYTPFHSFLIPGIILLVAWSPTGCWLLPSSLWPCVVSPDVAGGSRFRAASSSAGSPLK